MTDRVVDQEAGDLDGDAGMADATTTDATTTDTTTTDATTSDATTTEGGAGEPDDVRVGTIARWRERRRRRVSTWDRPPSPKDWRYVVGTTGRVLIAIGLLMFGFVAYQLWGTGIETARAQAQLEDEFEEQVDALTRGQEPVVGVDNWVRPVGGEPPDASTDGSSDDETDGETDDGTAPDRGEADAEQRDDRPDVDDVDDAEPTDPLDEAPDLGPPSEHVPGAVDLSDFAIDQDVPIVPGDSFALIEIPEIGVSQYVIPGVKLTDLKRGIGHYPDTPLPGQLGNASLAGHRTTYGAPFFDLDQLEPGDEIVITMITGDRFVYEVTGAEIVQATDYWVVTTRDPNVAELTLTTCDPKYTARNRLIIHSVLVPEKSSQVGVAEFYQTSAGPDDAVPGDDPTLVTEPPDADPPPATTPATAEPTDDDTTDDTNDDTNDDTSGTETTGTTATTGPDADEPADESEGGLGGDGDDDLVEAAPPVEVDPDELDAFSQGWFDDRGAVGHIALWGIALTIISLLAHQVSKRTRHHSIGFAVGVAPFLFCLYFFYQNVNRLLPPGL